MNSGLAEFLEEMFQMPIPCIKSLVQPQDQLQCHQQLAEMVETLADQTKHLHLQSIKDQLSTHKHEHKVLKKKLNHNNKRVQEEKTNYVMQLRGQLEKTKSKLSHALQAKERQSSGKV